MTRNRIGLLAAFALVSGVALHAVLDHENTLDTGRVVLLELAPVDPRSLMQGDYMALRFAVDRELAEAAPRSRPDYLYLALDDAGRARLAGHGDGLPAPPGQVAMRLRWRDGGLSPGPNAYFFQEGTAALYDDARWGEFRVREDGTALLTGLRDGALGRLGPGNRR